ncbi:hypothetical protein PVAP13_3NG240066 [Panicum virgatum]|uniref:Uncharacterized protein n=1 Tax=Panicum virgatum TaxID=38727 RepID=A0A8T0TZ27_PANVG|nr:hypothetical protein PVAP13_3NG240066 [Panicum virgatum]
MEDGVCHVRVSPIRCPCNRSLHFLKNNAVFETQKNSRRFRLRPFAPPLSLD